MCKSLKTNDLYLITDSKAPEGRDIGNIKRPSAFLAPEGRNIGDYLQKTLLLRPSGAKNGLY
jgi:hypothetical protein